MSYRKKPAWTFGRSRGPLRMRDVLLDDAGNATVQIGDWPDRRQSWFIELLREATQYAVATRVEPDPGGRLIAVEFRIFPAAWLDEEPEPGVGTWGMHESAPHDVEGLTVSKVRRASVANALKDSRKIIERFAEEYPEASPMKGLTEMGWDARARAATAANDLSNRPGRAGFPDTAYLPIAVRYANLVALGDPTPVKTMTDEMGRSGLTDLVRRCREKGLLTKSPPGKAGGTLTEKARKLIESLEGDDDDGQH